MITIKQFAEKIENDLNSALFAVLKNEEIRFKIWATAGEYQKPVREGNVITHEIIGNLRTGTSSNDANNVLAMGINGLSLDFMLPILPPRTNAAQTAEQLAKISGGQYPFLELIINVLNSYFQKAQVTTMTDSDEVEFSVAFQAGTVIPGAVELAPKFGNAVPLNVFIQVYFIEGGTNSKDVQITVDGKLMPFQAVRLGRAAVLERDVYAGESISKCFASSNAFSVDADFPSSNNPATTTALSYLLDGEANTTHFVGVQWGSGIEKLYFMEYNTVQTSATGIAVAGISASFVELGGNDTLYNLPSGFSLVKFEFDNSQTETFTFVLSGECETYIAGVGATKRIGSITQLVALSPLSFEYDEESGKYIVELVLNGNVYVTRASVPYTTIRV